MRRVATSASPSPARSWIVSAVFAALSLTTALLAGARTADSQSAQINPTVADPIRSLKGLTPVLPDVSDYIDSNDPDAVTAAQQLGKALFWDTQAGSDRNACASCHFQAGADIRIKNQLNPGLKNAELLLAGKPGNGAKLPNEAFTPADFPFLKLLDPTDRESSIKSDTDNVFASQGAFAGDFVSSKRTGAKSDDSPAASTDDACKTTYNPVNALDPNKGSPFHSGGLIYRKVEPRHTPSVINAVFNVRQFWDGRANSQFNGVDPFGRRTYIEQGVDPVIDPNYIFGNPTAKVTGLILANINAGPNDPVVGMLQQPLIDNASLASQAVGPPLSDFDLICGGKSFADLGRRLLPLNPLALQVVDVNDSQFSKTPGLVKSAAIPGLNTTYRDLVQKAFRAKWWAAPGAFVIDPVTKQPKAQFQGGYSQIEHNFSLFWGLAIQAYEQLLISDDSPFDRYMNGNATAISPSAIRGRDLFNGKANCGECHAGALLSQAAVTSDQKSPRPPIESMLLRDGYSGMTDEGFYNTGVRPTSEDLGLGGLDVYGFDLSFTRQFRWQLMFGANTSSAVDSIKAQPCLSPTQTNCLNVPNPPRDAVDGAFKAPILRNVGLTPPYFHTGGQSNLKDVVRFYNRGGDRRTTAKGDTSGLDRKTPFEEINQTNLAENIGEPPGSARRGLGLSEPEMDDLVAFLLTLSDDRVACHADVFDHPELPLVIGQRDKSGTGTQRARDVIATLPATGKLGLKASVGECFPNTGDVFDTLNKDDRRGLQQTFQRILKQVEASN